MAEDTGKSKKIVIEIDGPYRVEGGIPLVRKTQVVSEHGEPMTWQKGEVIPTEGDYLLCRCGRSKIMPFCDGEHTDIFFDGTETADTSTTEERRVEIEGGTGITVHRDYPLCMDSGFCGNRFKHIPDILPETRESTVRAQVIAMIERCPSGSYSYSIEPGGPDVEPDLPEQIAVMTEITDQGPITWALWVTGDIPIERSDGEPFETRNRVTLCGCGRSKIKPLCDGTHRPQ